MRWEIVLYNIILRRKGERERERECVYIVGLLFCYIFEGIRCSLLCMCAWVFLSLVSSIHVYINFIRLLYRSLALSLLLRGCCKVTSIFSLDHKNNKNALLCVYHYANSEAKKQPPPPTTTTWNKSRMIPTPTQTNEVCTLYNIRGTYAIALANSFSGTNKTYMFCIYYYFFTSPPPNAS